MILSDYELLKELIDVLEKKGILRRSYADVFKKTVRRPEEILFSQAVDPDEFAEAVSEITGIPYNSSPAPIEIQDTFFGENIRLNYSEIFYDYKVPIQGGTGILIPLQQHYGEENLQIISLPSFKNIVSFYVRTTPVRVEENIEADRLSEALVLILLQAAALSASDIHIDPFEEKGICSFRVDGDLKVFCSLKGKGERLIDTVFTLSGLHSDKAEYSPVSMRLTGEKVVASAKDHLSEELFEKTPFLKGIDFRIEIVPTGRGKSLVMRLLDKSKTFWKIETLGLQEVVIEKLKQNATKRGVLLVTGEAGSGKTTTCYALLSTIDAVRKKVVTIEDPIELQNPFWRQLQYREGGDYKLSFENLLSSVLRQDPDVILVGEVRNAETAMLLFQAANTGHSVVSTLHTNSVYDTIMRLADLLKEKMSEGEVRVRLSSFLKGVLSQRLLKRPCRVCGQWEVVDPVFLSGLDVQLQSAVKQIGLKKHLVGRGCPSCSYTGYRGRILVSEFVLFTKEVAEAVLRGGLTRYDFDSLIEQQGFRTILKDALFKARLGETNLYQIAERL